MAEKIEEIRQRNLEEFRDRAESEQTTEATTQAPMTPIQINGQAALTETVDKHDIVLVEFDADWCGGMSDARIDRRDHSRRDRRDPTKSLCEWGRSEPWVEILSIVETEKYF